MQIMVASPLTPNLFEPLDFKKELLYAIEEGSPLYFAYLFEKPFGGMMEITEIAYELGYKIDRIETKGFLTYFNIRR